MTDELPDVLRDLVAAERAAPIASPAVQATVRTKLGATLGIAKATAVTATTAATVAKTTLTLKIVAVVVTAGAIARAVIPSSDVAPAKPAARIEAPPAARVAPPAAPAVVIAPEPAVVVEEPAPPPRPAPRPVASQPELLTSATRALNTGDAKRALSLLDLDSHHHADGPLREERDALRVSALLALGRTAEAAARARELLDVNPHTLHRALLERALAKDSHDEAHLDRTD